MSLSEPVTWVTEKAALSRPVLANTPASSAFPRPRLFAWKEMTSFQQLPVL